MSAVLVTKVSHLEHADLLALRLGHVVHGLGHGHGPRAHDHHHVLRVGRALLTEEPFILLEEPFIGSRRAVYGKRAVYG